MLYTCTCSLQTSTGECYVLTLEGLYQRPGVLMTHINLTYNLPSRIHLNLLPRYSTYFTPELTWVYLHVLYFYKVHISYFCT